MAMLPQTYTLNALAVELGITPRAVATSMRDVPADATDVKGRPQWKMRTALAALGFSRGNGGTEYEVSRSKWMAARAAEAELSLKQRLGQLVAVPALLREIEQRWTNILLRVRQRFLAVPSKLAGQHSRLRTPQDVFAIATRLVHEALDLLAASSEAATSVPGIAPRRGGSGGRPGRQEESEEDAEDHAEEDLAGDGRRRAPRALDAEPESAQAADAAQARGSRRGRAARAGGAVAEPDHRRDQPRRGSAAR